MSKNIYKKNWLLITLVLALCIFGLVMVYSASFYSAEKNYNDQFLFLKKQFFGLIVGIVLLVICSQFNYNKFIKYRWYVLSLSVLLLVLVFVPVIGVTANGARRWIGFGGFTIQSSEVAKFGFVVFASCYMAQNHKKMQSFKGMLPVLLSGGVICLLILLEPNLSITLCVGLVMISMLLVGGIKLKTFAMIAIPALLLVPILIIIEPYRFDRLLAFLDPWKSPKEEGFQLIQSLYALGSGGMFGVGLFNSRQKFLFLPFSESDFIFSVIGEEFGLVGSIVLCLVYFAIIVQGVKISLKAKNRLGAYLAFGITSVITFQTLINIAVVTGSIPPTGIPLPFISAGGSSLMVFLAAIGVLLNISKQSQLEEEGVDFDKDRIFDFKRNKKIAFNKSNRDAKLRNRDEKLNNGNKKLSNRDKELTEHKKKIKNKPKHNRFFIKFRRKNKGAVK